MTKGKQTTNKVKSRGLNTPLSKDDSLVVIFETSTERGNLEDASESLSEILENPNYAGILIANEKRPQEKGTMGGVLMSDTGVLYGLTCFHAVKQNNQDFATFFPTESVKIIAENGNEIGIFTENTAIINSRLDVALIKLVGKFHNETIGSPTKFMEVTETDIGTPVYFFNDRNKKKVHGVIRKVNQEGNWRLGDYENIIFVSNQLEKGHKCISDEGDSGSWLLRESDNALIGVIFANSYWHTFVMPITEIIQAFQKKNITLTLNLQL